MWVSDSKMLVIVVVWLGFFNFRRCLFVDDVYYETACVCVHACKCACMYVSVERSGGRQCPLCFIRSISWIVSCFQKMPRPSTGTSALNRGCLEKVWSNEKGGLVFQHSCFHHWVTV